jgi:4-hydroxy-tetrahydrodipicolinate synthase
MTHSPFGTVVAPALTPFQADGAADAGGFVTHARWLLSAGCTGLAPFGTTSEGPSLSMTERKALLRALLDAGIDGAKLLPGTGLASLPETVELTRHAVDAGCGGVLLLPPFFFKGVSDEGVYRFYAQVIERVADSRLRVYLYHIPAMSGVGFSLPLIRRLREVFPEVVVGLKDSTGDWAHTKSLIEALPGFHVYSGAETALMDNLRTGGAGCICAGANVNAALMRKLADAPRAVGAERQQATITAIRAALQAKALIPSLKAVAAAIHKDSGWYATRPPLLPLTVAEGAALTASLAAAGFAL